MTKDILADYLASLLGINVKTKRFKGLIYRLKICDLKYLISQIEEWQEKQRGG